MKTIRHCAYALVFGLVMTSAPLVARNLPAQDCVASEQLSPEFDQAVKKVNSLTERPSDEVLLKLYGLFKQATCGDNNTTRPSFLKIEAHAKYKAWLANKGKSSEQAQKEYADFVNENWPQ